MEKYKNVIKEVESKYAPDKRTAIFQIDIKQDNNGFIVIGETNLPEAKQELLQRLNKAKLTDKIKLLPESELGDKVYGIINLSVANLRTYPDHQEELATQALLGTPVKILKKDGGWYLVQTPENYIAWIDGDGLFRVNDDSLKEWYSSEKIIYTNDFGFSYKIPDENSERVTDLVTGNILMYVGNENDYCKALYPDGKVAFIKAKECKPFNKWLDERNPSAENIIKTAKSFMGIPYLWGGTSIKGMDCSGFTKTAFFLNGIVLPRDASQQYYTGESIDTKEKLENLLPGDLLFFGKKASGKAKEKITHVAIYIGDGDYIHASGRVRINSFLKNKSNYNAYRDDSFVGARRILTSIDANGITSIEKNQFYSASKFSE